MTVIAARTAQPWRRVPDHGAERVAEGGRDHEDGEHLEEVRQRRRVLERVRRVHVEESAAVGAELLDGDLGRRGPDGQDLLGQGRLRHLRLALLVEDRLAVLVGLRLVVLSGLDDRDLRVGAEGLDDALRDEDEREHERERQQDVERRPREIDPEVADRLGGAPREPADEGGQRRHPGGGRDEVLHGEPQHLGQVAHGRLAAVALPVRVGAEADGGVERRIGRHGTESLRVQGQDALEPLERVDDQDAHEVEQEHGDRIGLPALLGVGPDAGDPVDQSLEPSEHSVEADRLALVDAGHVGAEWLRQQEEDDDIEHELEDAVPGHENTSGFSIATTR